MPNVFGMIALLSFFVLFLPMLILELWIERGLSPRYFFRSDHDRELGRILMGAIAMGPEGWTKIKSMNYAWKMDSGNIELKGEYHPELIIGGDTFHLYRIQKRYHVLAKKALRAWEADKKANDLKEGIERAKLHIRSNADDLESLDNKVVRIRELL